MASERIQGQIDRLFGNAKEALARFDRDSARQCAEAALTYGPQNEDAKLRLAARRGMVGRDPSRRTACSVGLA